MKSQVLYASLIFTVSALLLSTAMFTADARETTGESTKGNGVNIVDSGNFFLQVNPIADSKNFSILVGYQLDGSVNILDCQNISDKIVKIAALKKASVVIDSADKKWSQCVATAGDGQPVRISISVEADGEPEQEGIDEDNGCKEGSCSVTTGSKQTVREGTASITINDEEPFTIDGSSNDTVDIFKVNTKETYWEQGS